MLPAAGVLRVSSFLYSCSLASNMASEVKLIWAKEFGAVAGRLPKLPKEESFFAWLLVSCVSVSSGSSSSSSFSSSSSSSSSATRLAASLKLRPFFVVDGAELVASPDDCPSFVFATLARGARTFFVAGGNCTRTPFSKRTALYLSSTSGCIIGLLRYVSIAVSSPCLSPQVVWHFFTLFFFQSPKSLNFCMNRMAEGLSTKLMKA
mmetsp:Transcript_72856/g.159153  ORF Transcript_72856/g.159153 Transcript_72856/m.159153 type:complete len:206 (+) Transcript_72856:679-1296(+)